MLFVVSDVSCGIYLILAYNCSLVLSVVLLQEKKLLDLPKLLDICAIYGHENAELTKSLVSHSSKSELGPKSEIISYPWAR